jgi:acetyl-CoA acetyltransferase
MMSCSEKMIALTGIGQSDITRKPSGKSALSLTVSACLTAIEDAGLDRNEIDGIATWPGRTDGDPGLGPVGVMEVKEALGLNLNWFMSGGETSSALGPGFDAMSAIISGRANHVLVFRSVVEATTRAESGSKTAQTGAKVPDSRFQWQVPFGALSAANWCAIYAARHFHQFGTTAEQLGQIAVNARRNAVLNPKAVMRGSMTLDDYLTSRMISTPLRLFDCDVPVDASTALIFSRLDAANGLRHPVIRVEAVGSAAHGRYSWDQRADLTTMGAHDAAKMMWSRTDLKPKDVELAGLYDGFSILTLLWIEALGFAPHGEGGRFIEGGHRIARDGELPLNPHGGQLSEGRTHGLGFVHEAVLQMRGAAGARQIPRIPRVAVTGVGGGPIAGSMLLVRASG